MAADLIRGVALVLRASEALRPPPKFAALLFPISPPALNPPRQPRPA